MVCKRSLYCWKNGPCASDQTRKQIWEDNIRFRESLRDINQSDHYWSFQISKNRCLCLEGEEMPFERPLSRKFRSASLQRLHDIDCTSVTHDCNGLKFRNCFVHCPFHINRNSEIKRAETPIPQSLSKKENSLSYIKYPFQALHNSEGDKSEYCHRYKNTLVNSKFKPSLKTKFLSQSNLNSLTQSKNFQKKILHTSCEDISNVKTQNKSESSVKKLEKVCNFKKKEETKVQNKENEKNKVTEPASKIDCEVQTDLMKPKKSKELKPLLKPSNQVNVYDFSPISRTTRKMLSDNKKIPFATYGCNNSNLDIGSKRTHNVLASKLEVYPNALSAKQQKRNLIMKCIQNEKQFQKKCLPEELQRRINHSSLWSLDTGKKESKSLQSKYLLPVMNKPLKKINLSSGQGGGDCEMESPQTSKTRFSYGDNMPLLKVNHTPKNHKSSGVIEELGMYNLHREASPSFKPGQDVLEVGWGDSPEPLNVEKKFELNRTPITCKKKLETKESPKSSIPFKRRNIRSSVSFPSKSIVDVAKYVAEVQELSKNIMKEFNSERIDEDLFQDHESESSKQLNGNNKQVSPVQRPSNESASKLMNTESKNQNKDPAFDSVIQSFINEEDDWLSQALSTQEQKTPLKGNFLKSKSENELILPQSVGSEKENCRNVNNNFRRTSSFDLTKPQNSYNKNNVSANQYSLQEIERKRLEAKYRRERREIERKKLEALKKLEMKKLRVIKT